MDKSTNYIRGFASDYSFPSVRYGSSGYGGQLGYALVCSTFDGKNPPGLSAPIADSQRGPIRGAWVTVTGDAFKNGISWRSRDNMQRFRDGASNQVLLGEKHIPTSMVGNCDTKPTSYKQYDISVAFMSDNDDYRIGIVSGAQTGRPFISQGDDYSTSETYQYAFGSAHPGGANFCMADGSVRSMTPSTPTSIGIALCAVDDGVDVNLE